MAFSILILTGLFCPGQSTQKSQNVERVFADFEAEKIEINQGEKVKFIDKSKGDPIYWNWSFEHGLPNRATIANPEIYYPKAGSYDVVVTVTDGKTYDTKVIKNYVKVKGLMHHFRFDGLVRDEVNLSLSLGLNKWSLTRDRKGASQKALSLNSGLSSKMDQKPLVTNELTVSLWFRTVESSQENGVVLERFTEKNNRVGFSLKMKEGKLFLEGADGSGEVRSSSLSINPVNDNQWHHITAIITADSQYQLWIDGALEANTNYSYTIPELENDGVLTLGYSLWSESTPLEGAIDDLKIFNRALNMQEVVELASH